MSFCSQTPFYIKRASYAALLFRHFAMASCMEFCKFSILLNSTAKYIIFKILCVHTTLLFTRKTRCKRKDRKFPEMCILVVDPFAAEWPSYYLHITPLVYNIWSILLQNMIVTYLANLFLFLWNPKLITWKQDPANGPYGESAEHNPHLHTPNPQIPFPLQVYLRKCCYE
jgi:hypothetical protein